MGADSEKGSATLRPPSRSDDGTEQENIATSIDHLEDKDRDVAGRFLASLDSSIITEPISSEEARKVLRKIDFILIPLIMATSILAALDKVIISNAAIYGMKEDTKLVENQFAWVGSIFYFGYLVFEYPAALLIQRLPVAKFYAATVMGWAVLMLCSAATQNFSGLASVRFIMGMLESPVFPVSSILTVMWWKTQEQPIRVAIWFNQFSTVFSGIISYGIGHTDTNVAPWRLLFLVLGAFSVVWAVVLYIFLPDSPVQCWYLSDREKYICLQRVKGNNTGIEDKRIKWYQVRECLKDPKTWLIFVFSLTQNIPNGGLVTFSSIIVSGLGYSNLITNVLGIPTGLIATVWQLMLGFIASKFKNSRCIIIAVSNLIPMACAILMWKLPQKNQHGLLAAYYVFYTYWAPYVLSTSLPMANTSGHSKKLTLNALFFLAYCIGNILGPQAFRESDAPAYSNGYTGLLVCIVIAMASIIAYGFLCRYENMHRDTEQEQTGEVEAEEEAAFSDLTDKQKKSFRYTY